MVYLWEYRSIPVRMSSPQVFFPVMTQRPAKCVFRVCAWIHVAHVAVDLI